MTTSSENCYNILGRAGDLYRTIRNNNQYLGTELSMATALILFVCPPFAVLLVSPAWKPVDTVSLYMMSVFYMSVNMSSARSGLCLPGSVVMTRDRKGAWRDQTGQTPLTVRNRNTDSAGDLVTKTLHVSWTIIQVRFPPFLITLVKCNGEIKKHKAQVVLLQLRRPPQQSPQKVTKH